MKYVLFGNGGSGNHGCEAIVRGTESLIQKPLIISSVAKNEDDKYGLNQFAKVIDAKSNKYSKLQFIKSYITLKIKGDYTYMDVLPYLNTIKELSKQSSVALSVGGDNYCYSNQSLEEIIKLLGDKIGHLHLNNNYGKKDSHNGFENGNINVKQVLKLVDGYCDKPSMTIEVTDFNEAIESVEFILEYNNSRY